MDRDYKAMEALNSDVNAHIVYRADIGDQWRDGIADSNGADDCDGYGIAKYRRLLAEGWPPEQVKLATCWTEPQNPGYHCVCVCTVDGEDWVLDNRAPFPTRWQDTAYTWHQFLVYVPATGKRKWVNAKSWDDHPVAPY